MCGLWAPRHLCVGPLTRALPDAGLPCEPPDPGLECLHYLFKPGDLEALDQKQSNGSNTPPSEHLITKSTSKTFTHRE